MNILIINGSEPKMVAGGALSDAFVEVARQTLLDMGHQVRLSCVLDYQMEQEWEKYGWADALVIQFPVYWMMVPAAFKRYMDDVYTPATNGILCNNDGRSSKNPTANYGTGGVHGGKKYLLSASFNAPKEAFNNPDEYLFGAKGLDDLLFPVHCTYRFFGFEPLPSFGCFDVYKNPMIERDLVDWAEHLTKHFA